MLSGHKSSPRTRSLARLLFAGLLCGMSFGGLMTGTAQAQAPAAMLNVSYDPTRELYKAINAAFAAEWKTKNGQTLDLKASHAGSGAQARAIIDGLKADVVTLALAPDIDAIVKQSGKIAPDWQKRLPNNSSPYLSTILFLVKKGNPKGIKDWDDLVKPGVQVITPNPKTSGGARWNYLAAWGFAQKKFGGDEVKVVEFIKALFKNAPVLDTGARGSTLTFAQRGIGDVLIAWENDAFLAFEEFGTDRFEIITPSLSILAEPPVAVVDQVVDANGNRKLAEAYLQFLYTPAAQKIIAKNYLRPIDKSAADANDLKRFKDLPLLQIDRDFGGWDQANKKHFVDGASFDQIYSPGK